MSTVSENFVPYAHAEKELCGHRRPVAGRRDHEVEQRNGIKIRIAGDDRAAHAECDRRKLRGSCASSSIRS